MGQSRQNDIRFRETRLALNGSAAFQKADWHNWQAEWVVPLGRSLAEFISLPMINNLAPWLSATQLAHCFANTSSLAGAGIVPSVLYPLLRQTHAHSRIYKRRVIRWRIACNLDGMNEPARAMVLLQKGQTFDIMNAVRGLGKLVRGGGNGRHAYFLLVLVSRELYHALPFTAI